jgi:glyoxylase-like metal-dependent hydrolase (beta-lactamase superfamily II)
MATATAIDDAGALRELEAVPLLLATGLEVQWLGVSGYRITYEGVSLFVDPYVSRVPLRALLLGRLAMPDEALIDRYISAPGAVAGVLVGHTHFDHAIDAPAIARRFATKAYGSSCTASASSPRRSRRTSPTSSARSSCASCPAATPSCCSGARSRWTAS